MTDGQEDEERQQERCEQEFKNVVGEHLEDGVPREVISQALLNTTLDFIEEMASCPHEVAIWFREVQDEVHRRFELMVAEQESQGAVKH